jgi:acetolactate synthase-1/2/3 large subunit
MFTCQELATAVKYRLSVPVLIFNDDCYTAIKRMQEERFGRAYQVELTNPDFVKFAESFGAEGVSVETLDDLKLALRGALSAQGPTLIEVRTPLRR